MKTTVTSILALFSASILMVSQFLFFNKSVETPKEVIKMIDEFFQSMPSLPRYMEAGYSPLGRSPVVDVLLADPLYMPKYAEVVADEIKNHSPQNNLFSLATSLLTAGGVPLEQLTKIEILKFRANMPDRFLEEFPPSIAKTLHGYWLSFMEIQQEVETILRVFSNEEKDWIKENYNRFFFGKQDSDADYDFFTTDSPYPLKFFELASRINLAKLADCARKLSIITDDFYQHKEEFTKIYLEEDFIWEENNLKFIISKKSHATHKENADFLLTLEDLTLSTPMPEEQKEFVPWRYTSTYKATISIMGRTSFKEVAFLV